MGVVLARLIVLIPHLFRLASEINFRKNYSPPSSLPSWPYNYARCITTLPTSTTFNTHVFSSFVALCVGKYNLWLSIYKRSYSFCLHGSIVYNEQSLENWLAPRYDWLNPWLELSTPSQWAASGVSNGVHWQHARELVDLTLWKNLWTWLIGSARTCCWIHVSPFGC
jgi:hypothetical protein